MKRTKKRLHEGVLPLSFPTILMVCFLLIATVAGGQETDEPVKDEPAEDVPTSPVDKPSDGPDEDPADLKVGPDDVRIEQTIEGGYYLYVRAKPELGSVLLTESTEAPDRQVDTFAFRNPEEHPSTSDERRILDGEFLPQDLANFLVDSTPESDEQFENAFSMFVPYIVEYGYPTTRNGEVMVLDGTYLSIRAFEKPYADYSGAYLDNPFILRVEQKPDEGPPEGDFMEEAVDEFTAIAESSDGERRFSSGPDDTLNQIRELIPEGTGETLEFVLALDTTKSMHDDIPFLQRELVPLVQEVTAGYSEVHIGFLLYRDYMEEYLVRRLDFQKDLGAVQRLIDRVRVAGGRDIPEAVYEALWGALEGFEWTADKRMIVLIGDAPPHPRPRGTVTREKVFERAAELRVRINTIILPQ